VANNYPGRSICAFNTANQCVQIIYDTEVPDAHGLAFDDSGYLWVSDMTNDKIYRVDVDAPEGVEDGTAPEAALSFSSNPFVASVTMTAQSAPAGSTVEIWDLSGRLVLQEAFSGVYMWDGCDLGGTPVETGSYIVRITGPTGFNLVESITRL
jgi:hypothetical protein